MDIKSDTRLTGPAAWIALAAVTWCIIFAAQSWYHAAGGTWGAETFGPAVADPVLDREPGWVVALWFIGMAKLAAGALVVCAVYSWPSFVPHRLWLWSVTLVGAALLLYGGLNLLQHSLMAVGAFDVPDGLGEKALRWHLGLWDPWWMGGGAAFLVAARYLRRRAVT